MQFNSHEHVKRLADAGQEGAQRLLAGLYLLAKGTPRDPGRAYYWLERAGAGPEELDAVAVLMSPEDRARYRRCRDKRQNPKGVLQIFRINEHVPKPAGLGLSMPGRSSAPRRSSLWLDFPGPR